MSKLEELIQQYCPDGVEYLSIGSLITRIRTKGAKYPSIKTVYSVSNTLGLVKAEEFRENVIYSEDTSNYIVVDKGMFAYNPARLNIGSLAWLQTNEPGLVSPMYVVFSIDKSKIIPEFLYLHLKTPYVNSKINSLTESGARFRFDFERWGLIEIPVPPLPVQEEIVRILDTFTELQAELQAELQKRKQQYNYYRDNLLSFEGRTDVEWKNLDDVASHFTGLTYKPTDVSKTNQGTLVLRSTNIKDERVCFEDNVFVELGIIPERAVAREGDILICVRNGSKQLIGKAALIPSTPKPMAFGAFMTVLRAFSINNKFLFYLWQSSIIKNQLGTNDAMPINQITNREFSKISIPVPSLEEQQRIVDILDRFDTLTNDLTAGLPAEIEKRRQQYDYYRDKLLTFKRKEA